MFFIPLFIFGKEFIIINDSLVIISVMLLLLTLIIKNTSKMLKEIFETTRITTQQELGSIIKDILKFSITYRTKLENVIDLNMNRDKLLPEFSITDDDVIPENNIKEVYFNY